MGQARVEFIVAMRDRHRAWGRKHEPLGAPQDQWFQWREWFNARLNIIDAAVRVAMNEKRSNQRRKEHERKRNYGGHARGH